MPRRKYVALPIQGSSGKYVVLNLKDNSSVLIAQSKKNYPTHTDLITDFELAQRRSAEAVLKKWDGYDASSMRSYEVRAARGDEVTKPRLYKIRSKQALVEALEQFAKMKKVTKDNSLEGGGKFKLAKGIFTFHGTSDTYWGVSNDVLARFIAPLQRYYREAGKPLEDIVIK
jgi:hypothetical protein